MAAATILNFEKLMPFSQVSPEFSMAATSMLDSHYQAFFDIIDMLFFEIATFLPNLVKIGAKISDWHQFLEMRDGGNRLVDSRLPGVSRYHKCVFIRRRNMPTKFGENWSRNERMASVSRHARWRQPPCCISVTRHSRYHRYAAIRSRSRVATFPPKLVKIGTKVSERHQFLEIQDGGNRHVGFLFPGEY